MYKALCKLESNLHWRLLSWEYSFSKIRHVPKPNIINYSQVIPEMAFLPAVTLAAAGCSNALSQ